MKSQVSVVAKSSTPRWRSFALGRWMRARIDSWVRSSWLKMREDGRVVDVHALIAVSINVSGQPNRPEM